MQIISKINSEDQEIEFFLSQTDPWEEITKADIGSVNLDMDFVPRTGEKRLLLHIYSDEEVGRRIASLVSPLVMDATEQTGMMQKVFREWFEGLEQGIEFELDNFQAYAPFEIGPLDMKIHLS